MVVSTLTKCLSSGDPLHERGKVHLNGMGLHDSLRGVQRTLPVPVFEGFAGTPAMEPRRLRGTSSLTLVGRAKWDTARSNGARKRQISWPALLTRRPWKKGANTPTESLDFCGACRLRFLLDPQKHAGIAGQLKLALLGGQDNDAEGFCFPGMRDTNA